MKRNFIDSLLLMNHLECEITNYIEQKLQIHRIPKNTLILQSGEICDRLYFVYKGLARGFYIENEKEISSWFVSENDFIYLPHSLLSQKSSIESVELLEDSILISLLIDDLNEVCKSFPIVNKIGRSITEKYILYYDERVRLLRCGSEDCFKIFIDKYPHLFQRIPYKYLYTISILEQLSENHKIPIIRTKAYEVLADLTSEKEYIWSKAIKDKNIVVKGFAEIALNSL